MGMFCRFGLLELSRPVAVTAWLKRYGCVLYADLSIGAMHRYRCSAVSSARGIGYLADDCMFVAKTFRKYFSRRHTVRFGFLAFLRFWVCRTTLLPYLLGWAILKFRHLPVIDFFFISCRRTVKCSEVCLSVSVSIRTPLLSMLTSTGTSGISILKRCSADCFSVPFQVHSSTLK